MGSGRDIPLGRIAGIKVGMSVGVLLFAGLLTFLAATTLLPRLVPDQGPVVYWVGGAIAALLFFWSLLIHEIGHALVARDEGIGVHSMGLTILGGVTRMETSPATPGAEFRVSVVGPIASAAVGVLFLMGAMALPDEGLVGVAGEIFRILGILNLYLVALNSLPAAPLDGGKVLGAAIWKFTGSRSVAMVWTAAAGIVLGMVMLTYGIRELRQPDGGASPLSILLVGGFIAYAAIQQLRSAPVFRVLDELHVTDAMAAHPPSAPSWTTVGDFLRTSTPQPEHQAYPVVGPDGTVCGLLTAAAIRAVPPHQWDAMPVTALAYPLDRLTFVPASEALLPALQKVEAADVPHAMVVAEDGSVVGTLDPSATQRMLDASRAAERQPTGV
jgi:Zn-dependent protease